MEEVNAVVKRKPESPDQPRRKSVGNGQGSVYQEGARSGRTDGRWVAQVKGDDDKFRRTYHPTKTTAVKALRQMLTAVDHGTPMGDGNTTYGDLLDKWERDVLPAQRLTPATVDGYRWACQVLRDDLGTIRLRKLTPEHVEAAFKRRAASTVVDGVTKPGMSRGSLVKIRSVLSKTLGYARRRGGVAWNIAEVVELPAEARSQAPGRSLTAAEATKLLATSATFHPPTKQHPEPRPHELHALFVVMLYLGLRPGEATGLTWSDIDFDAGLVHVRRSLKLEHGELVVNERLKTDRPLQAPSRAHRTLEAPPEVLDALRVHKNGDTTTTDLVFATAVGTPLHPRNVARSLAAITNRAGLGSWHPHELRHSCASLLSAAGAPVERIADLLGHDGTRMAMLVYRHQVRPTVDVGLSMGKVLGG